MRKEWLERTASIAGFLAANSLCAMNKGKSFAGTLRPPTLKIENRRRRGQGTKTWHCGKRLLDLRCPKRSSVPQASFAKLCRRYQRLRRLNPRFLFWVKLELVKN